MKKNVLNAVCVFLLSLCVTSVQAVAPDYQDWWWDASQSGMGVNIAQQEDVLVASWYFFGRDGRGTFLVLSGPLKGNRLEGALTRTTGPAPGPGYDRAAVKNQTVGIASIEFKSPSEAFFTYQFDGQSGTIALQRFAYRAVPDTSRAIVTGATQQFGCGKWKLTGGPDFKRDNVVMHLALDRVGDNQYDLRLGSIEGTGGKSFWCEAKGLYLFLQGGVLNGAGNVSCYGHDDNSGDVILPVSISSKKAAVGGKIAVMSLQVNAYRTIAEIGLDFASAAGTQCSVMGSVHGLTLPAGN